MNKVKRSIRLPLQVANAVQQQAKLRGMSQYAYLEMCIHQGLSKIANEDNSGTILNEVANQIGAMNAQLVHLEKLIERALYVSCAAYSYSRISASSHRMDEAKINQEIQQAFLRQLNLAFGGSDAK